MTEWQKTASYTPAQHKDGRHESFYRCREEPCMGQRYQGPRAPTVKERDESPGGEQDQPVRGAPQSQISQHIHKPAGEKRTTKGRPSRSPNHLKAL